ncbi:MAG: bifunctional ornithine acetyltransferase/N-acetylglutamate synthase, partial [Anaerovoracaceae bacterium]
MKYIDGGVCTPKGFKAAGISCGFRAGSDKKDLAIIVSDRMCSAAGVYTTNKVKGAPIEVTKRNISD